MEVKEERILRIAEASQAGEARRIAVAFASRLGLGDVEAGRVAIVVTEVATNLAKHARHGELLVRSETGMGVGIVGARRLMDRFEIASRPGAGTVVTLTKLLPQGSRALEHDDIRRVTDALARERVRDPLDEVQQQRASVPPSTRRGSRCRRSSSRRSRRSPAMPPACSR
jgi:anti-sigma regulatory factor (Ser/Thr protein kinase)